MKFWLPAEMVAVLLEIVTLALSPPKKYTLFTLKNSLRCFRFYYKMNHEIELSFREKKFSS